METSTALVLYYTHCAFNQLAEMESGEKSCERKNGKQLTTLLQNSWQSLWELWHGQLLRFLPLTYPLFIICCEILLEQISPWNSRAIISPHRTFLQMTKRLTSSKYFTALC